MNRIYENKNGAKQVLYICKHVWIRVDIVQCDRPGCITAKQIKYPMHEMYDVSDQIGLEV